MPRDGSLVFGDLLGKLTTRSAGAKDTARSYYWARTEHSGLSALYQPHRDRSFQLCDDGVYARKQLYTLPFEAPTGVHLPGRVDNIAVRGGWSVRTTRLSQARLDVFWSRFSHTLGLLNPSRCHLGLFNAGAAVPANDDGGDTECRRGNRTWWCS